MCFTMGISALLGTFAFASAYYEYKCFQSIHYSLGIAYWGVMEWLQVFQHMYAARSEDNYAMCNDPTNQFLTDMASAHIIFQPLFISMLLMSMYRRHDITARIEADLIWKLSAFMGLWYVSYPWGCALMGVPQDFATRATEDCPNYMWLMEGYDGFLKQTTPNHPGSPCTYYAPTKTGHLAWVVGMPRQTYFFPGGSLHFFLFFAPYLVMFKRPFVQITSVLLLIMGPLLIRKLTPSVNEQPAIWCVASVVHAAFYSFTVRWKQLYKQAPLNKIHHAGGWGEQPMTYYFYRKGGSDGAVLYEDDDTEAESFFVAEQSLSSSSELKQV